jgi:transposase
MDSDMRTAQVERLEVVETGRRRRWSDAVKLKIVLESFEAPRLFAAMSSVASRTFIASFLLLIS